MGVLLSRLGLVLVSLALVACGGSTFRMRVAAPAGAELRVLGGPFSHGRTLAVPFVASFQPMGEHQHYEVRLHLPTAVVSALGGRGGELDVPGELHVYPATEVARHATADLPIDEARLGRLVRGEIAEAEWWIHDPNVVDGRLAHLRLHAPR